MVATVHNGGSMACNAYACFALSHASLVAITLHSSVACLQALDGSAPNGSYAVGGSPYMSKLESIASSAVKAADKVGASLIVVFTHTGMPSVSLHERQPYALLCLSAVRAPAIATCAGQVVPDAKCSVIASEATRNLNHQGIL
jgi:hypothetical protein